jgi:putative hemolysin
MNKRYLVVGFILVIVILLALAVRALKSPDHTGTANPASVYCAQNGGMLSVITAPDGSQSGRCKFSDGRDCEEWDYFRSKICQSPTPMTVPDNKNGCIAAGGKWGPVGISRHELCNLPTGDGGKICIDSSECNGTCIADESLTSDQMDQLRDGGSSVRTTGKCTAWRITVGCQAVVNNGETRGLLCVD